MKYRYLLPTLILTFLTAQLQAQQPEATVNGRVEGSDGAPLDGAVVSVLHTGDSAVVKVMLSEPDGRFTSEPLPAGAYLLQVTNIGFRTFFSDTFRLSSSGARSLPAMRLAPDEQQLDAVTVEAKKNFVEKKIDRTIVNVNSFIGNAGNNMLEVLAKSPGVSVDADGNIKLRGKPGVVVYIDDRPTYLSAEDLASYLRSLPSASVDVMEIMTNPPAKYDAAGNAGVINIRLKKTKTQGFNGGFSLSYGQGTYARSSNSLFFNYRVNKFNFFSNLSYNIYNTYQDLLIARDYYDEAGALNSSFNQHSYIKRGSKGANAKLGMDYYLSKRSTFGVVLTGFRNADKKPLSNTASILDAAGNITNNVEAYSTADKVLKNKGINVNYNYRIDTSGREIAANIDYLDYNGMLNSALLNNLYLPDGTLESRSNLIGRLPSDIYITTAKIDYTHPVKKIGVFSAGGKISYIKTNNVSDFFDENNGELAVNNDFTNSFNYKEQINAAYVNYNMERGPFSLQAGLRFENTLISGYQFGNPIQPDSSYKRTLNNLFPTLYLNYRLDTLSNNQLGISYGRRIDRPNYQDMNPFTYPLDRYTLYGGNPFLRPTISNNFELSHTYKNKITTTFIVNYIEDLVSETIEQSGGIFYSKPGNFGTAFSYGITLNANFNPVKWWTVQAYTELLDDHYKGSIYGQDFRNAGLHWLFNGTFQFQLSKRLTAEVSGSYQTRTYYAQFILIPYGSLSLGASWKFWKDNATIKAAFQDPFYMYRAGGNIIGLDHSAASWRSRFDSRVFTIAFGYRFNKGENAKTRNTGGSDSEKNRVH